MSVCPTCGRRVEASGCRRCRPRPPLAAPSTGAASRLVAVAGAVRVARSTWRPTPLALDEEEVGELRIDAGPSRPVPCPGCGARLAAHGGALCKACARAARSRPPVPPAPVGPGARLTRPVGPPGSEKGAGTGVKPSAWKPRPLSLDDARFQVDRDRTHIFHLRAPARPHL